MYQNKTYKSQMSNCHDVNAPGYDPQQDPCSNCYNKPAWHCDVVPYGETFEEACEYIGGVTTGLWDASPGSTDWPENNDDPHKRCRSSWYLQLLGATNSTYYPQWYAGLKHAGVSGVDGAGELVYDLGFQVRQATKFIPAFLPLAVPVKTASDANKLVSLEGYIILGLIGYAVYIANKKGLFK